MKMKTRMLRARGALVCCLLLAALGAVVAADLPFYKEGSGTTNRVPDAVAVSSNAATLDSRTVMSADSNAIAFNSDEARGIIFFIR